MKSIDGIKEVETGVRLENPQISSVNTNFEDKIISYKISQLNESLKVIQRFSLDKPSGANAIFEPIKYLKKKGGIDRSISLIEKSEEVFTESLSNKETRSEGLETLNQLAYTNLYYSDYLSSKQNKSLNKTAESFTKKSMPVLKEMVVSTSTEDIKTSFETIASLLKVGYRNYSQLISESGERAKTLEMKPSENFSQIISLLEENRPVIIENMKKALDLGDKNPNLFSLYNDYILICEEFIPEAKLEIDKVLLSALDKEIDIGKIMVKRLQKEDAQNDEVIQTYFKSLSYPKEEIGYLLDAWKIGSKQDLTSDFYSHNLTTIRKLESVSKGSAQALTKDFGIRCFSRYNETQLLKQFKEKDEVKPFGLICVAIEDHNSALSENEKNIEELGQKIDSLGFSGKIIEASSTIDFAKRLLTLTEKYNQKIKFLYFNGHGNESGIRFGNHKSLKSADLEKEHLGGEGIKKLRNLFETDAQVILSACMTGYKEGFASTLTDNLKITTIASTKEIGGFSFLNVKKNASNSNLEFDIQFYNANSNKSTGTVKYE